jgi:hypothetical protein
MKKVLFLLPFAALLISGIALGTPLQKENVLADAQWLLHLDFDAFRSSQFGQLVRSDIQPQYQEKIDALTELLGSDLTRDLYDVTIYGTGPGEENATILFRGSYDKDKLLALLVLNGAYSKSEYEGTTLHHWMDDKRNKEQYGAFAAQDLIVIGQTEEAVIDALDLIAGRRQSLAAQTDSALYKLCRASGDPIFMAAATELSQLAGDDEQAAILKNSTLIAMLAAEKDGNLTATLHLETKDEQAAIQVEQIARGLLAFAAMQNTQKNGKLIQSVVLTRDKNALDCTFSYPSIDLFEMIKPDIHLNIEIDEEMFIP